MMSITEPDAAIGGASAFAGQPGERVRYGLARLLGLRLISDMHERACELGLALPPGAKRRRRIAAVRRTGVLFIHIPKNAGQSVSAALYGLQVQHASIRYYRRVAPDLAQLPSFAVLRDPVDRFLSAYRYGLAGGQRDNLITPAFRARYMRFRAIEEALDHVESARLPYDIDHIFRPQAWYVTDRTGAVAVDRLLSIDDLPHLATLVPEAALGPIGHLNGATVPRTTMPPREMDRLRRLYADDFALMARATASRPA